MCRCKNWKARWFVVATFAAPFPMIGTSNAADVSICAIIAEPAKFNHLNVTVKGTPAGLSKGTSREGKAYVTFALQDPSGCGGVITFVQGDSTLNNSDQLKVEGVFETEHRRDGHSYNNELVATKVTSLPR